jgi:hypothetical protein
MTTGMFTVFHSKKNDVVCMIWVVSLSECFIKNKKTVHPRHGQFLCCGGRGFHDFFIAKRVTLSSIDLLCLGKSHLFLKPNVLGNFIREIRPA